MIVSFDFDGTLSLPGVQEYAKELMLKGVDVWVITSRFDELHKHLYQQHPTNDDLYSVCDYMGIPLRKIIFTNMELKAEYLANTNVLWHLDDDIVELGAIRDSRLKTKAVSVNCKFWKSECNQIISDNL